MYVDIQLNPIPCNISAIYHMCIIILLHNTYSHSSKNIINHITYENLDVSTTVLI